MLALDGDGYGRGHCFVLTSGESLVRERVQLGVWVGGQRPEGRPAFWLAFFSLFCQPPPSFLQVWL